MRYVNLWAGQLRSAAKQAGTVSRRQELEAIREKARTMLARMVPYTEFCQRNAPSREAKAEYERIRRELEATIADSGRSAHHRLGRRNGR